MGVSAATSLPDWLGISVSMGGALLYGHAAIVLALKRGAVNKWQETEADLDVVEIRPHRARMGQETKDIKLKYQYVYKGARFSGSNVSVLNFIPPLFSGYRASLAGTIEEVCKSKGHWTIFVNPSKPSQSIAVQLPIGPYALTSLGLTIAFAALLLVIIIFLHVEQSQLTIGLTLGIVVYVVGLLIPR